MFYKSIFAFLFDGLNRRARRLLDSNDSDWIEYLDNEEFWKLGWRKEKIEEE